MSGVALLEAGAKLPEQAKALGNSMEPGTKRSDAGGALPRHKADHYSPVTTSCFKLLRLS